MRWMMWLAALLAACPGPGSPTASPVVARGSGAPGRAFVFRVVAHENMHATFQYSSDDWEDAKVVLELAGDGAALVADDGELGESHVDEWGYSAKKTRWRNRWRGRWSEVGEDAVVELVLEQRAGEVEVTEPGHEPTRTPHPAVSARLRLTCRLGAAATGAGMVQAFTCTSAREGTLGTSLPWVFAVDGCLERVGGRMSGIELRPCAPDAD
jgi:hypothetical protein